MPGPIIWRFHSITFPHSADYRMHSFPLDYSPLSLFHPNLPCFLPHYLTGWWFVAKGQEEGWVPCSYLEPLNGGQEEDDTISSLGEPH